MGGESKAEQCSSAATRRVPDRNSLHARGSCCLLGAPDGIQCDAAMLPRASSVPRTATRVCALAERAGGWRGDSQQELYGLSLHLSSVLRASEVCRCFNGWLQTAHRAAVRIAHALCCPRSGIVVVPDLGSSGSL